MGLKKLYLDIYARFVEKQATAKGYDFQAASIGSVAPKSVDFKERLKWWTLNRPKRLRIISQERDRQQRDILAIKPQPASHTKSPSS